MRRRLRLVAGAVRAFLQALTDFFLPERCVVCGRPLARGERFLCCYCEADLPQTGYWLREMQPMAECYNAGIQRMLTTAAPQSGADLLPEIFQYAAALFFYQDAAEYKRIPQALKYEGRRHLGRFFGRRLGEQLSGSPLFADVGLILPVPLHPWRHFRRGYNQAAVLARAVAGAYRDKSGLPCGAGCPVVREDLLRRSRATRTQTQLSSEEKRKNVAGAFRIDRRACSRLPFTPRHILVVDDVFTSGATLCAIYATLRTVFPPAVRISVATLAFVKEA